VPAPAPPTINVTVLRGLVMKELPLMLLVLPVPVTIRWAPAKVITGPPTGVSVPLTVADYVYVTGLALAFATHSTEIIAAKTQGVNLTCFAATTKKSCERT